MTHPNSIRRLPKEATKSNRRIRLPSQADPGPIQALSLSGFVTARQSYPVCLCRAALKFQVMRLSAQPAPDTEKAATFLNYSYS